jgi:hypothetical protein
MAPMVGTSPILHSPPAIFVAREDMRETRLTISMERHHSSHSEF